MSDILEMAKALLERRAMDLRLMVSEVLANPSCLDSSSMPPGASKDEQAASAAIVEWLCLQQGRNVPPWVFGAPSLSEPRFMLSHAERFPNLRRLCTEESPLPFRNRGFLVPPDFLTTESKVPVVADSGLI